mmetsp:Transcript_86793/g.268721  ORF Transcript_86793/g.268721 Transcript_86793/m.268721 type:complete len:227 (-) Transcript_86793:51-731(-)
MRGRQRRQRSRPVAGSPAGRLAGGSVAHPKCTQVERAAALPEGLRAPLPAQQDVEVLRRHRAGERVGPHLDVLAVADLQPVGAEAPRRRALAAERLQLGLRCRPVAEEVGAAPADAHDAPVPVEEEVRVEADLQQVLDAERQGRHVAPRAHDGVQADAVECSQEEEPLHVAAPETLADLQQHQNCMSAEVECHRKTQPRVLDGPERKDERGYHDEDLLIQPIAAPE